MTRSILHDPNRYYHCECLEWGARAGHDTTRFYHCNCLEGGYTPPDLNDEVSRLQAENQALKEEVWSLREELNKAIDNAKGK